jgi:hypothetical protein
MIKIEPVETNKINIPQPKAVKNGILPKLPASYLVVGRSGSGKSTVLYRLLTSKELLGEYFNFIFVFSDVKTDDILQKLNLPDENMITDFDEAKVESIIDSIEKKIKDETMEQFGKEYQICFIFDDILGKQRFLKSNIMRKLASANRHYCISWFILTQYLRGIPPTVRQNASAVIFFPASMAEVERLAEENCEAMMNKKQFIEVVQHATSEPHSFLFINRKAENGKRLRKGFNTILSFQN